MFVRTKGSASRCRSVFAVLLLPVLFSSASFPVFAQAQATSEASSLIVEARERASTRTTVLERLVETARVRAERPVREETTPAPVTPDTRESPSEESVSAPAPIVTEPSPQATETSTQESAPDTTASLRGAAEVTALSVTSDNLISNGSFELGVSGAPQSWTKGSWGTLTPTFTYPVTGISGQAARVSVSGYASGDAKWVHTEVPVTAGNRYTYRDRYQATVSTNITAQFKNTSGAYSYVWLGSVPANSGWGITEYEFVVPSGIVAVTVFHTLAANGSLTLDEVALTAAASSGATPKVPACPLSASASRTVVDINGGKDYASAAYLLSNNASRKEIARSVTLAPGTYAVETVSWDGYPGRETVTQGHEQWNVEVRGATGRIATAGPTTDIADRLREDTKRDLLSSALVLTSSVTTVAAVHAYPNDTTSPNSVIPVCIGFEKMTSPTPEPPTGSNLIQNGSFEQGGSGSPSAWTQGYWGTLTPTFSYPVPGVTGQGARVSISGYGSGDAKWVHAQVPVTSGVRYRYVDRYSATVPTNVGLQYTQADGTNTHVWLGTVPESTAWSSSEFEFVVPNAVTGVTVFHTLAANGSLTLDDVTLTKMPTSTTPTRRGMVSVTFDDGWTSQYTDALPILSRLGVKSTFYFITDTLVPGKYTGYMTRAQVLDIHRAGHEIASHSVTHADLATLGSTKLRNELVNSKNYLQNLIGAPVTSLAYPFGSYNTKVITATKNAGYTNARTVEAGLNVQTTDAYRLKGYSPTASTPLQELTDAVDQAAARGEWMTVAFHEINTSGREYANTPAYLEAFLTHLNAADVDVVTVKEGLTRIRQ